MLYAGVSVARFPYSERFRICSIDAVTLARCRRAMRGEPVDNHGSAAGNRLTYTSDQMWNPLLTLHGHSPAHALISFDFSIFAVPLQGWATYSIRGRSSARGRVWSGPWRHRRAAVGFGCHGKLEISRARLTTTGSRAAPSAHNGVARSCATPLAWTARERGVLVFPDRVTLALLAGFAATVSAAVAVPAKLSTDVVRISCCWAAGHEIATPVPLRRV